MRILGIDPGLTRTGFGIIDINNEALKLVDYGIVKPKKTDKLEMEISKEKEESPENNAECDQVFEELKKKINNGESFVIDSRSALDMLLQCN